MKQPSVYLDLDRTIFQTGRVSELWEYLETLYPGLVLATREYERSREFYRYQHPYYYHDMSAQLISLGLDPPRVYAQLAVSPLADGRFEFFGCGALLAFLKQAALPAVLTYGEDEYQRCKAALCPSLREVPVFTTLAPKAHRLRQQSGAGWLIDDKPIGDTLPAHLQFIQVSLEKSSITPTSAAWPVLHSLDEVKVYLKHHISDTI